VTPTGELGGAQSVEYGRVASTAIMAPPASLIA
jgi:hypothetical protein